MFILEKHPPPKRYTLAQEHNHLVDASPLCADAALFQMREHGAVSFLRIPCSLVCRAGAHEGLSYFKTGQNMSKPCMWGEPYFAYNCLVIISYDIIIMCKLGVYTYHIYFYVCAFRGLLVISYVLHLMSEISPMFAAGIKPKPRIWSASALTQCILACRGTRSSDQCNSSARTFKSSRVCPPTATLSSSRHLWPSGRQDRVVVQYLLCFFLRKAKPCFVFLFVCLFVCTCVCVIVCWGHRKERDGPGGWRCAHL